MNFVSGPSWLLQLDSSLIPFSFRGYYVVVVPLKKQRGGKFLNPWEDPDQMNLDEVSSVQSVKLDDCQKNQVQVHSVLTETRAMALEQNGKWRENNPKPLLF